MNTKIQNPTDLKNVDADNLNFTCHLEDIIPLDSNNDLFSFYFCLFNKDVMFWSYMFNKLVSREEFKEFKSAEEYTFNALKDNQITNYQIKSICSLSEILYEAKLLREVGAIKNYEFVEIFMQVRYKLFQKYTFIKKAYLKKQMKDKNISSNSIQKLRAKLACLNEN